MRSPVSPIVTVQPSRRARPFCHCLIMALVAALLAGCPLDPPLNLGGKTCRPGTADCGANYTCPANGQCLASGGSGNTGGGSTTGGGGATCPGQCQPAWTPPANILVNLAYYASLTGALVPDGGCRCDVDCACNQRCVADPFFYALGVTRICEDACASTSDCTDSATVCRTVAGGDGGGKSCALNVCDPSNLYSRSAVDDAGEGSWLDLLTGFSIPDGGGSGAGACIQGGGNDGGACLLQVSPLNSQSEQLPLCPAGDICIEPTSSSGFCAPMCGGPNDGGCPTGLTCGYSVGGAISFPFFGDGG